MKPTMPLNLCFGMLFQLSKEPGTVLVAAEIGNSLSSFLDSQHSWTTLGDWREERRDFDKLFQ